MKNILNTTLPLAVRNKLQTLLYIVFVSFFFSCAQVVIPSGGNKDIVPPKVVKYIPDSASINFKSKSIAIFFDEFVYLKDLNNQLIISPPLEYQPDIKLKNKIITIDFDKNEILKSNTTYSISFGNAIQDIHENNPIENFKYVFSTGNFIDSLIMKGKIENAFDHKTEKGILVMLYNDFNDSVIYKNKPQYFSKTKEDGSFQINNISDGKFKLFVLKDANANYKYDSEKETVGFLDSFVEMSEKKDILIDVFQEPAKNLFLKKTIYNSYGKIIFVFNKSAENISIEPISKTLNKSDIFLDYSKNKDTLCYWFKQSETDSLIFIVKDGSVTMDTVSFKTINKEAALTSKRSPLKFTVQSSPSGNNSFDFNADLKIVFNNPLEPSLMEEFKKKKINLMEDTALYKKFNDLNYIQESISTVLISGKVPNSIKANTADSLILKGNTNYHLLIPSGTFTDIFGLTNDTIKIDFKTRDEKFYGTLKLKIELPTTVGNYIVQLLDEKENIFRTNYINNATILSYEYLAPKKYKLKIIFDENKNLKWDSGNLILKQQPEKVIYNVELINIRSNWDLELEWKVTL